MEAETEDKHPLGFVSPGTHELEAHLLGFEESHYRPLAFLGAPKPLGFPGAGTNLIEILKSPGIEPLEPQSYPLGFVCGS